MLAYLEASCMSVRFLLVLLIVSCDWTLYYELGWNEIGGFAPIG